MKQNGRQPIEAGLAGHAIHGRINWTTTAVPATSAALDGFAGGKVSLSMNKDAFKKSFGVLMLLIAARIIFRLVAERVQN